MKKIVERLTTRTFHSCINGLAVEGNESQSLISPFNGEAWGHVTWSLEQVDLAVDSAAQAVRSSEWLDLTRQQRADVLDQIGRGVEAHVEEIASLETLANGKPLKSTMAEVLVSVRWWQYYASLLRTQRDEEIELSAAKSGRIRHESVGVVALITPFNGAFSLGTWKLAPALAAGNVVILKPPLNSPGSSLMLQKIVLEAGVPAECFQVLQGGADVGTQLIADSRVNMVSFTGSTAAAKRIGAVVTGRLARFVAEAGGKSAHIVFDDANLSNAVTAVVQGAFSGTGQTCVAGSRVLVHRDVSAEFVSLLLERIARLRLGDPLSAETHLGPIATAEQYERIRELVRDATSEGARVLAGGTEPPAMPDNLASGYWLQPTVLSVEHNTNIICRTEVFGPVLTIQEFGTESEALSIANDSEFGLAAGFWTADMRRAHQMSRGLQAGTVWVNTYRGMDWQTPFGGYKLSGLGRENGVEGLREFQQVKAVIQEFGATTDPFEIVS
ncbi:aldehyde dehydrogenase family protein [Leucobacter sp. W1038]|uniref:aldehyde dehydrogenase family protein n=1 Tax=Leucobacter sp. W1038 TaxID=3438281 RepID=UPI003D95B770